jgi:hypothetical protein
MASAKALIVAFSSSGRKRDTVLSRSAFRIAIALRMAGQRGVWILGQVRQIQGLVEPKAQTYACVQGHSPQRFVTIIHRAVMWRRKTASLCQGITMSTRIASIFAVIGLLTLTACADQTMDIRHFTAAQVSIAPTDADAIGRPLTTTQLSTLSDWINARNDWSGLTVDEPEHPSMQFHLQNANGLSSNLLVYQRDNGSATAYLHYENRLAPLMRRLSDADLATLKSIVNGQ